MPRKSGCPHEWSSESLKIVNVCGVTQVSAYRTCALCGVPDARSEAVDVQIRAMFRRKQVVNRIEDEVPELTA